MNAFSRLRPRNAGDDSGASVTETAVAVLVAAGVITAVANMSLSDEFNDGVREMVCLIEGPECDGETWTAHDRPAVPKEADFNLTGAWSGEVEGTGDAATAIAFALQQKGDRYLLGANGPDLWDCSSLVQAAWRTAGVSIPRTTWTQIKALDPVDDHQFQPGDLLFFHTLSYQPPPSHVGMYIGNGRMVHAGDPVQEVTLNAYWMSIYEGAGRPPQD
ncbi:C40 family peptidase [Salinactinospora qingdaonensis]